MTSTSLTLNLPSAYIGIFACNDATVWSICSQLQKNPLKHKLDHMQYIFAYELHVYKPFIYLVISSD